MNGFSGSIASCLQSIGQPLPHDRGFVPVVEVGAIVKALRQHLDGIHDYALHCPRAVGLSHAHTIIGVSLLASVGVADNNAACFW